MIKLNILLIIAVQNYEAFSSVSDKLNSLRKIGQTIFSSNMEMEAFDDKLKKSINELTSSIKLAKSKVEVN